MRKTILLVLTVLFTISTWAQAPAVGRGRYDQQIQQEVTKILSSKDKWQGLTASTEDGIVTLRGTAKVLIVKLDVYNINVLPTSPMDDDIRLRVARAIYGNSSLSKYGLDPAKPIRIVVDNGHVTLYGVVDSQMDKQIAETQTKSVPNVFSVDD